MKIAILCNSVDHPIQAYLLDWAARHSDRHDVEVLHDKKDLTGGDVLFLVSCSQIIGKPVRSQFTHCLVLHASDLPEGRGWSPHVWQLLEGRDTITVSLLNAEDKVDTGAIWKKAAFDVPRHALHDEINDRLFKAELSLMDEALEMIAHGIGPKEQSQDVEPTYHRKRTPADSEVDPERPLTELFDAIRVADPARYPAFFRLHGHTYTIEIKKVTPDETDHD